MAIAVPLHLSATRLGWMHRGLTTAVGAASCLFGLILIYRMAFIGALAGSA